MLSEFKREFILENYGEKAVETIENYMQDSKTNLLLVYKDENTFNILGGILTNHSMTIDEALKLLEIDMNTFVEEQGWEDWDYEALDLIGVK